MPVKKAALIAELNKVIKPDSTWAGAAHDVVLDQVNWTFVGPEKRAALQLVGERFGCHVCLSRIEDNPGDQLWDADHQPPVRLTATAMDHYGIPVPLERRLYPQCKACSQRQAQVVRRLRMHSRDTWPELREDELRLLRPHDARHRGTRNSIVTRGDVAGSGETGRIQGLGEQFGCHTCNARYPVTDYEADHVPPTTIYQYTWMISLMAHLGLTPTTFVVRPACPSCQRSQGGKTGALLKMAATYIYEQNLSIPIHTEGYARSDLRVV